MGSQVSGKKKATWPAVPWSAPSPVPNTREQARKHSGHRCQLTASLGSCTPFPQLPISQSNNQASERVRRLFQVTELTRREPAAYTALRSHTGSAALDPGCSLGAHRELSPTPTPAFCLPGTVPSGGLTVSPLRPQMSLVTAPHRWSAVSPTREKPR